MEKLRFGRGLEARLRFGSRDTEEGIPNEEKDQESNILLRSPENVDTIDSGPLLRALKICV